MPLRLTSTLVVVTLAACKASPTEPAAIPDCDGVGAHVATQVSGDRAVTARVVAALCTHDQWAAETRRCLAATTDRLAVTDCATQGLTPEKAERFTLRLTHLTMGGELAAKAADVTTLDGPPRAVAKPAATCGTDGLRLALGLQLLIERKLPVVLKGGVDGTVGVVTRALCERDRWPSAALECARDAPAGKKGTLDPCVALLSPAQRDAWTTQTFRALEEVEREIAAGTAQPGAIWGGTIDPTPVGVARP